MSGQNKILIVDDDIITRYIAKLIFKDNFEVLEAENGQVAARPPPSGSGFYYLRRIDACHGRLHFSERKEQVYLQ